MTRINRSERVITRADTAIGSSSGPDPETLAEWNNALEGRSASDTLQWAWSHFGPGVAASSSFQTQSVPLLHLIATTVPDMPVMFLDTGYHFPETLGFRDDLVRRFGLRLVNLTAERAESGGNRRSGPLYRSDPDRCCWIHKVAPLNRELQRLDMWVSGIRRDQTLQRSTTPIVAQTRFRALKLCPMASWSVEQVWSYIRDHDLPVHPLHQLGYRSVGCAPCTRPVTDVGDDRSGRWTGTSKTECGLHVIDSEAVDGGDR
jgi:phosphoadenosine phosphosulfate reductase